jgi:excisionase family DNA binding protein
MDGFECYCSGFTDSEMTYMAQKDDVLTLKVKEAARLARTGDRSIYNLINAGAIPALYFGRTIRIPRAAFLKWLENGGR